MLIKKYQLWFLILLVIIAVVGAQQLDAASRRSAWRGNFLLGSDSAGKCLSFDPFALMVFAGSDVVSTQFLGGDGITAGGSSEMFITRSSIRVPYRPSLRSPYRPLL